MPGLIGMKQIRTAYDRSEATILKLYHTAGFPMTKIGGQWESTTEDIDEWRRNLIRSDVNKRESPVKKRSVKPKKW